MSDEELDEAHFHRAQAVTANNTTWELLDSRDHTSAEGDDLLQRAYAAAYHWRRAADATAVNWARASWLVSRAHVVLGDGDVALRHADRIGELMEEAGDQAADFDHGYRFEARARALACLGRLDDARAEYDRARAVQVSDEQDRKVFDDDLMAEPWFGLDRA